MNRGEELRYLALAVQREGNRQLTEALRDLKLTPAQAEVFLVLQQYQPMTLVDLGERLVCETGSPSRLVSSMVEAGWVEKLPNPNDGRAVFLHLTPKADAILPALNQINEQFNENVAAAFGEDSLDVLIEHLWPMVKDSPSGRALLLRKNNK
jgi:MarR family transcriptional regulator, organic hydroperoxide resistance regulator